MVIKYRSSSFIIMISRATYVLRFFLRLGPIIMLNAFKRIMFVLY